MNEKVISYAGRTCKYIPPVVQGIGLGLFLGHVVENNPDFKDRLEEIDDKYFMFEATDTKQCFFLHIKDKAIKVKMHLKNAPDVIMKGEFSVLIGLLLSKVDPDNVFFSRKLQISGNTATALCFKNILDSID